MPDAPTRRQPWFNHVAMSVSPDLLDETGREELASFYGEVFGWHPYDEMTEDRHRLVLGAGNIDQFVFLIADEGEEPMSCPRLDHFGIAVDSVDRLETILERAERYRERDDRVDIIDRGLDDFEVLRIHNCYIGYLLPMMVEVQYWEFADGAR